MPTTNGSTDAVEELARLVERNEAALLDMGLRPFLMRAGMEHAVDAYRVAQRTGDPGEIATADKEMGRVLRTTIERLAEGGVAAAERIVQARRQTK